MSSLSERDDVCQHESSVDLFMKSLICISEKCADVARECRLNEDIFAFLIKKKDPSQGGNVRFNADFKTVADVFIQSIVTFDLTTIFPCLCDSVHGEESNEFTLSNGDVLALDVKSTVKETQRLLQQLLWDLCESKSECLKAVQVTADKLAVIAHTPLKVYEERFHLNSNDFYFTTNFQCCVETLGIWIDPIDGTNEYIKTSNHQNINHQTSEINGIHDGGLPVATVLIGVFDKITGKSVMGVVNCPFETLNNDDYHKSPPKINYTGSCHWGIAVDNHPPSTGVCKSNHNPIVYNSASQSTVSSCRQQVVGLCSKGESTKVKNQLKDHVDCLQHPSGAGYKLFCVCVGKADLYIVTRGDTIFKWDTCGPHALLKSRGGNIVSGKGEEILYAKPDFETDGSGAWGNKRRSSCI